MFKKSARQKRLEALSKLMGNGYKYALIDNDGEIKSTCRYTYEANKMKPCKNQKIVLLQDLFNIALKDDPAP